MLCFFCKKNVHLEHKISFREECPFCSRDLHICKNCKYYDVHKPHECSILNIEPVRDKEKFNFCEEFREKSSSKEEKKLSKEEIEKKLFKF